MFCINFITGKIKSRCTEPEQADEVINVVLLITFSPFCCLRGEIKNRKGEKRGVNKK